MKFILVWRDSLFSNLLTLGQDNLHLSHEVQLLSNGCASLHLPSKSFTMRNQRNQLKISPHCSNGSSSSFLAALAALYLPDSLIVLNSDITSSKTMKILKGENYDNKKKFWWHHLVVKFWTNTSGTTYNWPNLEPKQVAFYLAGEITQVIDSIPWVRCASGNVLLCKKGGRIWKFQQKEK